MSARGHVSKGQFIIADGGKATIGRDTSAIRKGVFLTSTPRSSSKNLQQQFPEFEDVLAHAGPVPSAANLAQHWARQAELEDRLASLKARIKSVKRK